MECRACLNVRMYVCVWCESSEWKGDLSDALDGSRMFILSTEETFKAW